MPTTADLPSWTGEALAELVASRNADGGWAYVAGGSSATEATCLAALAVASLVPGDSSLPAARTWLEIRQSAEGGAGASAAVPAAGWVTPLAGMALGALGAETAAQSATDWLLAESVFVLTPTPTAFYGYDTTIPGFPWTSGDYSFVEPTSLATVFLKRRGQGGHARVRESIQMLEARRLPGGGWNYGEPIVLGGELFPAAVPTSLALLAMNDEPGDRSAAREWLASTGPALTSLFSLGWAGIALNVLGRLDATWQDRLVTTWKAIPPARRDAMGTALCLLAAAPRANHPFAVPGGAA